MIFQIAHNESYGKGVDRLKPVVSETSVFIVRKNFEKKVPEQLN